MSAEMGGLGRFPMANEATQPSAPKGVAAQVFSVAGDLRLVRHSPQIPVLQLLFQIM